MNLPPPLPMYSDPNEPLLQSVTPPPLSPLLQRVRWLWSRFTFAIDRSWRALLRRIGLRPVDAREAGSLAFVTFGVAVLTMGLYFGSPTILPPATRDVSTVAPSAPREQRLALRDATKTPASTAPAPAARSTPPSTEAMTPCTTSPVPRAIVQEDDAVLSRASDVDGALEPPARRTPRAQRARSSKGRAVTKGRAAKGRFTSGARSRAVQKAKARPSRARSGKPANRSKPGLRAKLARSPVAGARRPPRADEPGAAG